MKRTILSALLLSFFTVLCTTVSFAQKTLKGKVVDATSNNILTSATITFSGKGGTATDKDGNFTVDCSKTSYIIIL